MVSCEEKYLIATVKNICNNEVARVFFLIALWPVLNVGTMGFLTPDIYISVAQSRDAVSVQIMTLLCLLQTR